MSVAIIDYGVGNLRSVQKIFERIGSAATITGEAEDIHAADALVLPGVGAFRDAMARLSEHGMVQEIKRAVLDDKKPLLGICLGMQLLAQESEEGGAGEGLGLVPASVRKLQVAGKLNPLGRKLTLPHIGWNEVRPKPESILFRGISEGSDFYFLHSYRLVCDDSGMIAASCEYGETFPCAVERDNIFAAQFHPEKSQKPGQRLIRNFLEHCERVAGQA